MSDPQFLRLTVEDRVATLTIDRPPVNALNEAVLDELAAAVTDLNGRADVKAVVVTGAGQLAFVAGADINVFDALLQQGRAAEARALAFLEKGQAAFSLIEAAPKPYIAAINGVALGGGLELAMACHLRIVGDRARLGQPEINLGIIPGWGGTQRLPRLVGRPKAIELILTGDPITAQEALRLNLVNKVVPGGEVLKTARDLARRISPKGALAVRAALEAITQGSARPLPDGLAFEAERLRGLVGSADMAEGISAFLQKRQPAFKDQ